MTYIAEAGHNAHLTVALLNPGPAPLFVIDPEDNAFFTWPRFVGVIQ